MEQKEKQTTESPRTYAERIIAAYMKQIYRFALNRTESMQDAEDIAQEICLKIFKALSSGRELYSEGSFVWKIARKVLANYYRGRSRSYIGINIDEVSDLTAYGDISPEEAVIANETVARLQDEIAYLSKTQRRVIALYYYTGKKVSEIATILNVPEGTVKWHLSDAKNKLLKGMETVRTTKELKFNPIKFDLIGMSGSSGTMGVAGNFFRGILSQNIAYCILREAKTINEISGELGVSPVYVESEVEFLDEYGLLTKKNGKYLVNFLLDESDSVCSALMDEIYETASEILVPELFDRLNQIISKEDINIYYPENDSNFLMWSILLYTLANNGEEDTAISFNDVAVIRPDGGCNIVYASIVEEVDSKPKYYENLKKWCGPMWNATEKLTLWQIDSEWSEENRTDLDTYQRFIKRDMKLLENFTEGNRLSEDEYAFLAQKGYIRKSGSGFELSVVWLKDNDAKRRLLEAGNDAREVHKEVLTQLKEKYRKYVLSNTPAHLKKMQQFSLQHMFAADGWFLLFAVKTLLRDGRLKLPTQQQKKSLSMLILTNTVI
ncbi:MAG: hypothetical protein CVU97_04420 [Firmicutes bacterium HGW-Firmicutes-21]|nr:MAG: hypothetical protein CVU97_04420 [Firmicutes bacterium HGW-Firmicutes-21]